MPCTCWQALCTPLQRNLCLICPSPLHDPAEMHAAAAGNIVAAMSDLDGFTAKLSAILQADLTHAGAPAPGRTLTQCCAWPARFSRSNANAAAADVEPFCCLVLAVPRCAALAAGPLEVAPNLMQQLGSVLAVEPGSGGQQTLFFSLAQGVASCALLRPWR